MVPHLASIRQCRTRESHCAGGRTWLRNVNSPIQRPSWSSQIITCTDSRGYIVGSPTSHALRPGTSARANARSAVSFPTGRECACELSSDVTSGQCKLASHGATRTRWQRERCANCCSSLGIHCATGDVDNASPKRRCRAFSGAHLVARESWIRATTYQCEDIASEQHLNDTNPGVRCVELSPKLQKRRTRQKAAPIHVHSVPGRWRSIAPAH